MVKPFRVLAVVFVFVLLVQAAGASAEIKVTGGKTSDLIDRASILVFIGPEISVTKVTVGDMTCEDANGQRSKVKLSSLFNYELRSLKQYPNCFAFKDKGAPFELVVEKKNKVEYRYCEAELVVSFVGFSKPVEIGEGKVNVRFFERGYAAKNVREPKTLESSISNLKDLGYVPKVVVTYGKHEPGEPSARLFETKVNGKTISDYFGDDVVFIKIPQSETPEGFYTDYFLRVRAMVGGGKFSKGLSSKLAAFIGYFDATPLTEEEKEIYGKVFSEANKDLKIKKPEDLSVTEILDADKRATAALKNSKNAKYRKLAARLERQEPLAKHLLSDKERLELYEKLPLKLPLSDIEFSSRVYSLYAGCPEPFHLMVHYGGEPKGYIAASSIVLSKNRGVFDRIPSKTGFEVTPAKDFDRFNKLFAKFKSSKTEKEQLKFVSNLLLSDDVLAKQVLRDYSSFFGMTDLNGLQIAVMELNLPIDRFVRIGGDALRGSTIRNILLFNGFAMVDGLHSIEEEVYLKKIENRYIRAYLKNQHKKVVDTLKIIQSYSLN